jgi:rod shape determining protein RodA
VDARVAARNVDWVLVGLTVLLGLFGLLAQRLAGDAVSAVRQEAVWLLLGLGAMAVLALTDYHVWARWTRAVYGTNLALLCGVLVVGHRALGAQRWLGFGPVHLQPSEVAKVAVITSLAALVAPRFGQLRRWRDALGPTLFVLPPALLVMLQPDLGTSLVFFAILAAVLFVAGMPGWRLLLATAALLGLATGLIVAHYRWHVPVPLQKYQLERLVAFTNPAADPLGTGYQILQSEIAIGSGQLTGKGLGPQANQTLSYQPEADSDFVFATVAARLGFVGAGGLLLAFYLLLARGVRIAAHARDAYGTCLAAGVVAMLAFHVVVNAGMAMGMMPVTGVPLPFISAGGSALLADCAGVGLLLSVHMRRKKIQF